MRLPEPLRPRSDLWRDRGFSNLFSSALFALMIVYFVRYLRLGAATIGWTMAVVNLGFIAGAFVTRFMYWGTIPIGSALGGVVAQSIGLRATLFAAAGGSLLGGIPIFLSPIRKLHALPEPPAEPALSIEPLIRATVEVDA